jgi:phosphate transport system substrate-binding protein
MSYGLVRNAGGTFVKADFESVTEAAAGAATDMPDDFRVSITNAPGKNAYPISTFTWLLIPNRIDDASKRAVIKEFLEWMLGPGQQQVAALSYAPLPELVIARGRKQIAAIQ